MGNLTESESNYDMLEFLSIRELLESMNDVDFSVPGIVKSSLDQIERLVEALVERIKTGGRLFYLGAGTSGRLGVLDASECPPTFGVSSSLVNGIIAGGKPALTEAIEFAEDNLESGWQELNASNISEKDFVIGISASGNTPFVLAAMKKAKDAKIPSGCIVCNAESAISETVDYPIEIPTGSEFLTGSTRMKAGTAQKLVLNMISTSLMIRLGKVKGNKMIDMKISNEKLQKRGVRFIMLETGCSEETAFLLLKRYGDVRHAIESFNGSL